MTDTPTPPERAHVLVCKIEADSTERLADHLREMAEQLELGKLTTGCTGGYSSGATYSYKINPEQTHDIWFRQLSAYLDHARQNAGDLQGA